MPWDAPVTMTTLRSCVPISLSGRQRGSSPGSLGCGASRTVSTSDHSRKRQGVQDRLHLPVVGGPPQPERPTLAGQRPEPPELALPGQLPSPVGLARLRGIDDVAWRSRRDRDGEGGEELAALDRLAWRRGAASACGPGSFGCGDSAATSSVRHTRRGMERSTDSSPARSAASKRPSVRHSPGCRGGRQRRRRCPCRGQLPRVGRLAGPHVLDGRVGGPVRDVGGHGDQILHRGLLSARHVSHGGLAVWEPAVPSSGGQLLAVAPASPDSDPAATCWRSFLRAPT